MKRALMLLAALGIVTVMSGCGSNTERPVPCGGSGLIRGRVEGVPLVGRLVVAPLVGKAEANGARPLTVRMTLVVANTTSREYLGDAPDAALARFAMTVDGETLWTYPTSAAQVVTPVRIAPGQQLTYTAVLTIADARPYIGKVLLARGQFVPASLTTTAAIPVN